MKRLSAWLARYKKCPPFWFHDFEYVAVKVTTPNWVLVWLNESCTRCGLTHSVRDDS